MEIIKMHYKISKNVSSYKEIKEEVEGIKQLIKEGKFKGNYQSTYAIAHCQVSETPMAFFVVSPEYVKNGMFDSEVIINPQIIDMKEYKYTDEGQMFTTDTEHSPRITPSNKSIVEEGCMSFPFRKQIKLTRYDVIVVRYQIPSILGLKYVRKQVSGITSQVFQHEIDHLNGRNIYFNDEMPINW